MIGIYQLEFENGNKYIGQSIQIEKRIYYHNVNKGIGSPKLQRAYIDLKYLGYTILEECKEDELAEREIFWIKKYTPSLNTLPGGEANRGLNHPKAKYTEEDLLEVVRLFQDINVTYKQISDITGVHYSTVQDVCKGRSHQWATKGIDIEQILADRQNHNSIIVYDPEGNKYIVDSKGSFEKEYGLSPGSISALLNTKGGTNMAGWSLFPPDLSDYIVKLDCKGEETERHIMKKGKIREFLKDKGLSKFSLSQILNLGKSSKGWSIKKL